MPPYDGEGGWRPLMGNALMVPAPVTAARSAVALLTAGLLWLAPHL